MADATLKMLLVGEDRGATKTINSVGSAAERSSKHMSGLGSAASAAVKGFLAFEAVQKVTEFLKSSAEEAMHNQSAMAILGKQMHNTAHATDEQVKASEEWLTKASLQTGVAKDQLIPAYTQLITATGSVGKAHHLTGLAMNISAGTGKNLTAVSMALAKAQNGTVGGLSRLGIATKDAAGHTKTFAQLQDDLAKKFKGDAAAAADTQAGKMRRLGAAYTEIKEQVGNALLPILGKFSDWMVQAAPKVEKFFDQMRSGTGTGGRVAADLKRVGTALENVGKFAANNKAALATFIGVLGGLSVVMRIVGFVKSLAVAFGILDTAMDANPVGAIVLALAALAAGLVYAYRHSETFRNVVQTALHGVAAAGRFMWNDVLEPVLKGMLNGFSVVANAGAKMLDALSHVPGFGWAKSAADALRNAGDGAKDFANQLGKIPGHKDVKVNLDAGNAVPLLQNIHNLVFGLHDRTITIRTVYKAQGAHNQQQQAENHGFGGPKRTMDPLTEAADEARTHIGHIDLGDVGAHLVESLVKGVTKHKVSVKKALHDIAQTLADAKSAWSSTLVDFASGFQGMESSIFSDSDPDTGPLDVNGILASQASKLAQASQINADVTKLSQPGGLSQALISELQASGSAGITKLHALATSASMSQLQQLNSMDASTTGQLTAAGYTAGNYALSSSPEKQALDVANAIHDAIASFKTTITLKGDTLIGVINASETSKGKKKPIP